jgi:hypothetical protein
MPKDNGVRKNITICDPKTVCYLEDLKKKTGQSWDNVLKLVIRDNLEDRDKQFQLKFSELEDWVRYAYPGRKDILRTVEILGGMVTNRFFIDEPKRMLRLNEDLNVLNKSLVVELRTQDQVQDQVD